MKEYGKPGSSWTGSGSTGSPGFGHLKWLSPDQSVRAGSDLVSRQFIGLSKINAGWVGLWADRVQSAILIF